LRLLKKLVFLTFTYYTAPTGCLGDRELLVIMWTPIQHEKHIETIWLESKSKQDSS